MSIATTTEPIAYMTIRWGRLTLWEDYEDTERIAAWDAGSNGGSSPATVPG